MSHTVHKYALTVDDEQFLGLPRSARILRVECQHGASDDVLQLWVWVKPKDPQRLKAHCLAYLRSLKRA